MQAQHMIIFAGIAIGLILLTCFTTRAILLSAYHKRFDALHNSLNARHSQRIEALNKDITDLNRLHKADQARLTELERRARVIRATPFTKADHLALLEVVTTLRLAKESWDAFPGTEPYRKKAISQSHLIGELAYRMLDTINSAASINGDSLDTQLIEWLDRHGDLTAAFETSEIRFPHTADTEGYSHIRDALREAFERHKAHAQSEGQEGA